MLCTPYCRFQLFLAFFGFSRLGRMLRFSFIERMLLLEKRKLMLLGSSESVICAFRYAKCSVVSFLSNFVRKTKTKKKKSNHSSNPTCVVLASFSVLNC
jgi:hypothetical protein